MNLKPESKLEGASDNKVAGAGGMSAGAVALFYAICAALWILISDWALERYFYDVGSAALVSTLKGWLFVIVTASLLFVLLQRFNTGSNGSHTDTPDINLPSALPLTLIVLAIAGITTAAIYLRYSEIENIEAVRVESIAKSRASEVARWLSHRMSEAEFVRTSPLLADYYLKWRDHADLASRDRLLARVSDYRKANEYESGLLANDRAEIVARDNDIVTRGASPELKAAVLRALATGKTQSTGIYHRDGPRNNSRLDIAIPLLHTGTPARGAVVLRLDPATYLYPLLRDWPAPSKSAESILVLRASEHVTLLSPLRHSDAAPGTLKVEGRELLPVRAAENEANAGRAIEAIDYRGTSVLGAGYPVANSNWMIVAKIDHAEIIANTLGDATWIALAGLLAIFATVALGGLHRTRVALQHSMAINAEHAERMRALQLLDAIASGSPDAIFVKDRQGRYLLFNRRACQLLDTSEERVIGQDDRSLFPTEQAALVMGNDERVMIENRAVTSEEHVTTAEGDVVFLATKGPIHDDTGTVIGMFGISRDITRRKRDEHALAEAAQQLQSVQNSIVNQMVVLDRNGYITSVNEAWRHFAIENSPTPGVPPSNTGIAVNYLDICDSAQGPFSNEAADAREGIRKVLSGESDYFAMEYSCHAPLENRWFQMSAVPLQADNGGAVVVHTNITERKRAELLLQEQARVLEMIARNTAAALTLDAIARNFEALSDNAMCSILLTDNSGSCLRHAAGPSLPASYNQAIDGIAIGPGVGSCGTAAYTREEVVVEDIHSHPYWRDFVALAEPLGLRSCWSTPIIDAEKKLLGTFAIYRKTPGGPTAWHRRLVNAATNLVSICLNHATAIEDLHLSEVKYRRMVDALTEGLLLFNDQGHILAANPAAEKLFGYSEAEMIERWRDPRSAPAPIDENGSPLRFEDRAIVRVLATGEAQRNVLHGRNLPDGSVRWNIINAEPLREHADGPLTGVIASFTDITQRYVAEQQLRKLSTAVDQSFNSIIITDANARIEYVNDAFIKVCGYDRGELIGQNPRILKSGKTSRATYIEMWNALTAGDAWQGEFTNRRKNGKEFIEVVHISPIRRADGTITHYLGIREDITERKRTAAELDRHRHHLEELVIERTKLLEQSNAALADEVQQRKNAEDAAVKLNKILDSRKQALERLVRNLESFSYSVSHDLRAPLRAISGYAEMLDETEAGKLSDEGRHMLTRVKAGALKMDQLIKDILEYSRAERMKRNDTTVDLTKIAEQIAQDLKFTYPRAEFVLGTVPAVIADPTMVQQILSNLLSNAFKFSAKRENARIEFGATDVNGIPEFFISDNGAGFNQKYAGKLFNLFQRMHSAEEFAGTGVGLAVVKRLVEHHDGRVSAESVPDEKTLFRFTLAPDASVAHAA